MEPSRRSHTKLINAAPANKATAPTVRQLHILPHTEVDTTTEEGFIFEWLPCNKVVAFLQSKKGANPSWKRLSLQ